jgi:polyisoprenoid-binding protein YceI
MPNCQIIVATSPTGRGPGVLGRGLTILLLALCALCPVPASAQTSYTFDAAGSTLEVHVYKGGLLKAAGHEHLVVARNFSGTVHFNPNDVPNASVVLYVLTKSLTVSDPGESVKDREQVQATLQGESVLDVAHYPDIVFRSKGGMQFRRQGNGWRVVLPGLLRLHNVEKQISLPLTLSVVNGELLADGDVYLLQSDYGIHPIRIAGGLVKVRDRLRIHFKIRATPTTGSELQ